MKKVLLMIIYFVLLLGFVGCNNNYEPVQVQIFSSIYSSTDVQNKANIWLNSEGNTIKVISTDYKVTDTDRYNTTYHIMITYQRKD